jgi:Homeodomain-like domain
VRSEKEVAEVKALSHQGLNHCQIARRTGIPRTTIRDWLSGRLPRRHRGSVQQFARAPLNVDLSLLPRPDYAYLLAMYLGDGCISTTAKGNYRLRIFLDAIYPGIVRECAAAMRAIAPVNAVHVQDRRGVRMVEVGCTWRGWLTLFPQHGAGTKHLRKIELHDWQREIVDEHPKPFLRGLIHSDGCRVINKSMGHEYVRYFFTNASSDIRALFGRSCDQLEIGWREPKERDISIARREDVAFLDEFIGPKY